MIEKTISTTKINILSIPITILIIGLIFYLYFLLFGNFKEEMNRLNGPAVFSLFLICIFIHELIHGLFFARYTKEGFKNIHFGIKWKALTPYCYCNESIQVRHYRVSIIAPTLFLGFIPLIFGFIFKEINIVGLSTLMIIGGIGDFFSLWMLKDLSKDNIVLDHPNKIGFLYNK